MTLTRLLTGSVKRRLRAKHLSIIVGEFYRQVRVPAYVFGKEYDRLIQDDVFQGHIAAEANESK